MLARSARLARPASLAPERAGDSAGACFALDVAPEVALGVALASPVPARAGESAGASVMLEEAPEVVLEVEPPRQRSSLRI